MKFTCPFTCPANAGNYKSHSVSLGIRASLENKLLITAYCIWVFIDSRLIPTGMGVISFEFM